MKNSESKIIKIVMLVSVSLFLCASVSKNNMNQDLPKALGGQSAGTSHGALIVLGGSYFEGSLFEGGRKFFADDIYVLEPKSDKWINAGKLDYPTAYAAAVTIGNDIIVIGGSDGSKHYAEVTKLEWKDRKITKTSLPPLPQPLANIGAANIGKTIYVVGGIAKPNATEASGKIYTLDLDTKELKWTEIESMPAPARMLSAVAANDNTLFVISGAELYKNDEGKAARRYLNDAWKYSKSTGWSQLKDIPRSVVAASATSVDNSRILVFSGDDGANASRVFELKDNHPGLSRDILSYDLKLNSWSKVGEMPVSLVTTSAIKWNSKIVIPGGEDRPGHRSALFFSF